MNALTDRINDWQKCLIYYVGKWLGEPAKKQKETNKPKGKN